MAVVIALVGVYGGLAALTVGLKAREVVRSREVTDHVSRAAEAADEAGTAASRAAAAARRAGDAADRAHELRLNVRAIKGKGGGHDTDVVSVDDDDDDDADTAITAAAETALAQAAEAALAGADAIAASQRAVASAERCEKISKMQGLDHKKAAMRAAGLFERATKAAQRAQEKAKDATDDAAAAARHADRARNGGPVPQEDLPGGHGHKTGGLAGALL